MQDQFLRDWLSNPLISKYSRMVICRDQERSIAGYYTLSAGQIAFQNLPSDYLPSKLSYPVPAIRIGQLAVDRRWQRRGMLGKLLLSHAIATILLKIHEDLGVVLVTLDVEEDNAVARKFYLNLGFTQLPTKKNTFIKKIDSFMEEYQS